MKHLYIGNYYYDLYTKTVQFHAGFKGRKYLGDEDWYWEYRPNLWKITCKACIKKLVAANKEAIEKADNNPEASVAVLRWGENFTPETWPVYS